jgi:hypothetical protein
MDRFAVRPRAEKLACGLWQSLQAISRLSWADPDQKMRCPPR